MLVVADVPCPLDRFMLCFFIDIRLLPGDLSTERKWCEFQFWGRNEGSTQNEMPQNGHSQMFLVSFRFRIHELDIRLNHRFKQINNQGSTS
jgi:hypothetical protein